MHRCRSDSRGLFDGFPVSNAGYDAVDDVHGEKYRPVSSFHNECRPGWHTCPHASHIPGIVGTASGTQVSVEHKRSLFPGLMAPSRQACTCPATTEPASIRSQCPRPGQPRLAGHGLPAAFRSGPARTSRRPQHRAPASPPHPATP